ncbi:SAM-dependent methyltransferase [Rhodobacteraceae bacterium KMM 6894]|nr:SAM-dependent methyltransferase [Rhodobacteraceae bacterium KMM 6894]
MLAKKVSNLWKRLMLRGADFGGAYARIRMIYAIPDPWEMSSDREQYRFAQTVCHLQALAPSYNSVLEFGCGEGHQSTHLETICKTLYGVDISSTAVARAKDRCPQGNFQVAGLEDAATVFERRKMDLITACEVLYYAADIKQIIPAMQARAERLYVSNYKPRSDRMRQHFQGDGWERLDDIQFEDTVWECFFWQGPGVS